MHELSIAQNIVEIVGQNIAPEQLHAVRGVRMRVGEMAGVVSDSLEFCYEAIVAHTPLQASKLIIEKVPFLMECKTCHERFRSSLGTMQCPHCETFDTVAVSGTELEVAEIEIADAEVSA